MICYADTEVFSEADLKKVGAYKYAEHPSTELLVLCYAFGDGPVNIWVPTNTVPFALSHEIRKRVPTGTHWFIDTPPPDLREWIESGKEIRFHNAGFDRTVLNGVAGKKLNFPAMTIEQTSCSSAQMRAHGLPGGLEEAAVALGTAQKSDFGKGVMYKLCRPRTGKAKRYGYDEAVEEYAQLYHYCANDVVAARAASQSVPELTESERRVWILDQHINARGIGVDLPSVANVQALIDEYKAHLEKLCLQWTGFQPTQRDKLAEWVRTNGYPQLSDMTAETVNQAVKDPACPEPVGRVLRLYSTFGMKAVSKYESMVRAVCADGRVRGMFMYYGAGPGRWSSQIVQLQNLYRPKIEDTDTAIDAFAGRDLNWIRDLYEMDPMKVFASCVRGMLIPAQGKNIMAMDFTGIESRLTAWVFDETWKIKAFNEMDAGTGPDMYKLAYSRAFRVPVESVTKAQRQIGKVLELSMGFEGGVGAFVTMVGNYGVDLAELTEATYPILPHDVLSDALGTWEWAVKNKRTLDLPQRVYVVCDALKRLWRLQHPAHVAGWANLKESALQAVLQPGKVFGLPNKKILFCMKDRWLYMRLPSGRKIAYYKPHLDKDGGLRYWGVNTETRQWTVVTPYGGRFCQNFSEGIARDLLVNGLFKCEEAGVPTIGSVHDEGLFEPAEGWGDLEKGLALFTDRPAWAAGLPLNAEGFVSKRYRK